MNKAIEKSILTQANIVMKDARMITTSTYTLIETFIDEVTLQDYLEIPYSYFNKTASSSDLVFDSANRTVNNTSLSTYTLQIDARVVTVDTAGTTTSDTNTALNTRKLKGILVCDEKITALISYTNYTYKFKKTGSLFYNLTGWNISENINTQDSFYIQITIPSGRKVKKIILIHNPQ